MRALALQENAFQWLLFHVLMAWGVEWLFSNLPTSLEVKCYKGFAVHLLVMKVRPFLASSQFLKFGWALH